MYGTIVNRPLKSGSDTEWFKFQLAEKGQTGDVIGLDAFDATGPLTITLYDSTGNKVYDAAVATSLGSPASVSLAGLPANGTTDFYYVTVSGNGPARFALTPTIHRTAVTAGRESWYTVDLNAIAPTATR